jgi:hypothetical protein
MSWVTIIWAMIASVAVAEGIPNPWMLIGQLSLLLFVIFVADAAITVWQRGDRRQAMLVGGSIVFLAIAGTVQVIKRCWRIARDGRFSHSFRQLLASLLAYHVLGVPIWPVRVGLPRPRLMLPVAAAARRSALARSFADAKVVRRGVNATGQPRRYYGIRPCLWLPPRLCGMKVYHDIYCGSSGC